MDCIKERGRAFPSPAGRRVCPSLSGKRLLAGFAADRHPTRHAESDSIAVIDG
ncbi:hypothetical protein ACNKHM_04010 [Shigella sonnei]